MKGESSYKISTLMGNSQEVLCGTFTGNADRCVELDITASTKYNSYQSDEMKGEDIL